MDNSPNNPDTICPHCGAALPANAKSCWLCLATFDGRHTSEGKASLATVPTGPAPTYSMSSLMMFVTLICVVLGVLTIAPGLGVILAFIAFVAWLRTAVNVRKRSANHEVLTTSDKLLMFFRSAASTFLILGLVLVACVVMLFIACLAIIGSGHT